ncbi:MAG: TlyA family RNA methyltransferase [Syntrophorhabdaceae bacterium]|nr:TlyA family RNA methyltransferase [Syntrophorhabdaceae bacterium]
MNKLSDRGLISVPGRCRLDAELVERGLAETRAKAQGLILAGKVLLSGEICSKCGAHVKHGAEISLIAPARPFVSRGGEKLDGALDDLKVDVSGHVALDVGASTGGFTDCLLRRGALRVYAVDVGERLLDDRLRKDSRVIAKENVNFRYASADLLPEKVSVAVVDVSFISLRHILPALSLFLTDGAQVLSLVKPQFEVGKGKVGKGGVVRDDAARGEAVESVAVFASGMGYEVAGEAESRVRGPKGNREVFLKLLWKGGAICAKGTGPTRLLDL